MNASDTEQRTHILLDLLAQTILLVDPVGGKASTPRALNVAEPVPRLEGRTAEVGVDLIGRQAKLLKNFDKDLFLANPCKRKVNTVQGHPV